MERIILALILLATLVAFGGAFDCGPRYATEPDGPYRERRVPEKELDRTTQSVIAKEFALSWALRVGGGLVALFAAFGLFGQWYWGGRTDRLVPGIVVLLAGLAVGMQSWPVILSLGAIAVTHTITTRRTE